MAYPDDELPDDYFQGAGNVTGKNGLSELFNVVREALASGGGSGSGDVVGPASATDNALARFDTATGELIQDGVIIADDSGNLSGIGSIVSVADAAGDPNTMAIDTTYAAGAFGPGDDGSAVLVTVDKALSTGGRVAAVGVLTTGAGDAEVYSLAVGASINPLLQLSGVFVDLLSVLVLAVDQTTALSSGGAGNVAAFVADNDTMTVGFSSVFGELTFELGTVASGGGISPVFEYSTGVGTWSAFSPVDGTNGMRSSGGVVWITEDLAGWVAGAGGEFLIRVTRTRNSLSITPVIDLVQVAVIVVNIWDAGGNLNVRTLVADITARDITDPTKLLSFDVSNVPTGITRTISMADRDVDLSPLAPRRTLSALSATANYGSLAGNLRGNASGFVMGGGFRVRRIPTETEILFSNLDPFDTGTGGFFLGVEPARFRFGIRQLSNGALIENFGGGSLGPGSLGKIHFMVAVFDGVTFTMYLDGYPTATLVPDTGYQIADIAHFFHVGRTNNAGAGLWPAPSLDILGFGYDETVPTAAAVADHYLACLDANDHVDGGLGYSNLWSFRDELTPPATLLDSVGSVDLTLAGAPTILDVVKRY